MSDGCKCLLDTSVQVKRLVSQRWREAGLDRTWEALTPVASMYSFMEFKNSVIGALRYLVSILQEIESSESNEDVVSVRLSEVIRYLNMDSASWASDRRIRMASAYAAKLLDEAKLYQGSRPVVDVIEQIQVEAENLEQVWFFFYAVAGKAKRMDVIDRANCYLARHLSPMDDDVNTFRCRIGELPCNVLGFIATSVVEEATLDICRKTVKVRNVRLLKGAAAIQERLASRDMEAGRSIGEHLCLPIGDCIILAKAHAEKMAILTADRDQASLALHVAVPSFLYDASVPTIIKL